MSLRDSWGRGYACTSLRMKMTDGVRTGLNQTDKCMMLILMSMNVDDDDDTHHFTHGRYGRRNVVTRSL